jgi:hypothetical protein
MDCYLILGARHGPGTTENKLDESYAAEVIRIGTDATSTELSPCATPRPASPSASSPPARATLNAPWVTDNAHYRAA